jgi:2'-5' RNA ligase
MQETGAPERLRLAQLYDSMWQEASEYLAQGKVQTDPHLLDLQNDRRLGLTLIARPGREVVERISEFLQTLKQVVPDQHYYQPDEFHVTVLSLFTATDKSAPFFDRIPAYRNVLRSVLAGTGRFQVAFKGITASGSAVMVQGFPHSAQLNQLREELRAALRRNGLGESLDKRYRITTAHITVMRFRTQPQGPKALLDTLARFRDHDFGQATFQTLQWVKNDWYMSSGKVEVLEEYALEPSQHIR